MHKIILLLFCIFLVFPSQAEAVLVGQRAEFFIDSSYDASSREILSALLLKAGSNVYYYADAEWWSVLSQQERDEIYRALESLDFEFYSSIYPILVSNFGSEWKPGIDGDVNITLLLHPMGEEVGGYTNYGDEYPRVQNPESNEREMIYLNTSFITSPLAKGFLAHEFVHLISFNQKDNIRNVSEETWLNEARAEYASTLLGYDEVFVGSNMQKRAQTFLERPGDPLVAWSNEKYDYAVVNMFTQYLVDHYGLKILQDSLWSSKVGAASISEALQKNGFLVTFEDIFTDWTIAVLVNDCSLGERYCYRNPNLQTLKIVPQANFLPLGGNSLLSSVNHTQDWAGNWYRVIGGRNILKIEFQGDSRATFALPYIVEDKEGKISVRVFNLNGDQEGTLYVQGFNSRVRSLTLLPSAQTKLSQSDDSLSYQFTLILSTVQRTPEQEQVLIEELLAQIEFLKAEIARLQALLVGRTLGDRTGTCRTFEQNLYFGIRDNPQVRCLQEFLKNQGPDIYPEGIVSGNFLSLTQQAVIRFQEKYADQILQPLGLTQGTGYFGPATRAVVNQTP